jgi:DNA-binding response OmpR family regulator
MKALALLRHLTALYVEDDPIQRALISGLLRGFFHELITAENGEAGLRLFQSRPIHLVIADIQMPGMDGLELIAAIRQLDRQVPIFIVSAYAETSQLLTATRLHLADYLLKPLSEERLRTALEHCAAELLTQERMLVPLDADTLYFMTDGCLRRRAEIIPLTPSERTLLNLLLAHRGQWLSRERLLAAVYVDRDASSAAGLKNLILRLRQKLGDGAITNQYGVGYRLIEREF